jgi:voltage-gated potassium channel
MLILIFGVGILGYMAIEGWDLLDAIYMTVITLTSVGFEEVRPLSVKGRIFTILLILGGVGIILSGITIVANFILEGQLGDILRRKRMDKEIEDLRDHYILCGLGETGKHVASEFARIGKRFIGIERDMERIKGVLETVSMFYIHGDATHDATLLKAGIKRAKGLITTLSSDADNLFVVLTARELNPDLRIITRCIAPQSETKLRRAGADRIISPNAIGGLRMASAMIRPSVIDFLDLMLYQRDELVRIEEVKIPKRSRFIGQTLGESEIGTRTGVVVIAIKDSLTGEYTYAPNASIPLKENDLLIVIGEVKKIERLRRMV